MTDDAKRSIRNSVLGADRGFRVIDGGAGSGADGGGGGAPPVDQGGETAACPVTALGHLSGTFHFLDVRGQKRDLTARQLGARHDLLTLFGGEDGWLRSAWPKKVNLNAKDPDAPPVWKVIDFSVNEAAAALQRLCFAAGLFGDHVVLRKPGVWRDANGDPAVHCGDQVFLGGVWRPAGERTGGQVWAAAPPAPRPGTPCTAAIGRTLADGLRDLWRWASPGAPTAVLGLIANAYYGGATDWRPAGFFTGETGGGKSSLLTVIRNAIPMHHHDNDTSKAGIEQAVNGRAMAIIIDEAADRANREGARNLIDLVLSAASGEGTKGSRGTVDGKGRRIELAGLIMMFSINPPDLEPQHLGRFTMVELLTPEGGADHRTQHRDLAQFARAHGPALWARALASWDRYGIALATFRDALKAHGCAPREMDQAGALLAGWWVLVHEGIPDTRGAAEGIASMDGFVRLAKDVATDGRPRRMLQHMLSSLVTLKRSTEREPLGKLMDIAFGDTHPDRSPDDVLELLKNYGIRVVRRCLNADSPATLEACGCVSCKDFRKRSIPRQSPEAGAWFANQHPELRRVFDGTPFDGERWRHEMARLPGARKSGAAVRIGGYSGHAIWLGRADLDLEDSESGSDPPGL